MEVHAHTHTEGKKWTHYLWEFLMLFFAVFCGFLAENQRERLVERQREKSYIASLVEDIQLDTAELNRNMAFRSEVISRIDSLFFIFKSNDWQKRTADIYFFCRRTTRRNDLFYHDRTIQQLKNSGGLRLIRSIDVSNMIVNYDARVRNLLEQQRIEEDARAKLRERIADVFDPLVLYDMSVSDGDSTYFIKPEGNPALKRPEEVFHLLGELQYLKNIYQVSRDVQKKLVQEGNSLISILRRDYHVN